MHSWQTLSRVNKAMQLRHILAFEVVVYYQPENSKLSIVIQYISISLRFTRPLQNNGLNSKNIFSYFLEFLL